MISSSYSTKSAIPEYVKPSNFNVSYLLNILSVPLLSKYVKYSLMFSSLSEQIQQFICKSFTFFKLFNSLRQFFVMFYQLLKLLHLPLTWPLKQPLKRTLLMQELSSFFFPYFYISFLNTL